MFQPDYTETVSMILETMKELQEDIFLKKDVLDEVTVKILNATSKLGIESSSSLLEKRSDSCEICPFPTPKEPSSIYEDRSEREEDFSIN
ncbi:hypothetical protein HZH68_002211 [Vespula germanica]|uniref:Uncharacterized protein n=1 Tax=Vespula germanica TaxID=30212 RepID=A0A834KVM8_VESGE|nr:hypothetical protein HZH68_002211 [Vespula germanica]